MSNTNLIIPENILKKWQKILDGLAEKTDVPCATITRVDYPEIEGFLTSNLLGNPATAGDRSLLEGTYCEHVIENNKEMLVPNALEDPEWDHNPDIEYGLIAYLGVPLLYPDGEPFGTICILDTKENHFSAECSLLLHNWKYEIEKDLVSLSDMAPGK